MCAENPSFHLSHQILSHKNNFKCDDFIFLDVLHFQNHPVLTSPKFYNISYITCSIKNICTKFFILSVYLPVSVS